MDINEFISSEFCKNIDLEYKNFSEKIANSKDELIGIRIPIIRKIAKDVCKNYDVKEFLESYAMTYFEEFMIYGIILASAKIKETERMKYIINFVGKIQDWSVCDSMCASFKIKKYKSEYYSFLMKLMDNRKQYENEEFVIRFVVVMLMDHFLDDEYLDNVLKFVNEIREDYYYTNMAMAWLISCAYIKNNEKGYNFLQKDRLSDFTHNKSISKICDSYRVSGEEKEKIKKLRRKVNR